jgi:hypothetical protein
MKKILRVFLVLYFALVPAFMVLADPPEPPTPGNGEPPTGSEVGAPIDHGYIILIAFVCVLMGYKIYQVYKTRKQAA